jgi:hypothetical protein
MTVRHYGHMKMFKKFLLTLLVAALLATLFAMIADRRGFGELAVRAAIADQAGVHGTKCPLSPERIDKAEIGLLSICLNYGLGAYEAAERYPATAARIFAVYGNEETFQEVLDRYGHQVIPVIEFFVENGSRELQIRQALGNALQEIWAGKKPKWELAEITREQVGLIAIYRLAARGHEMLAEFEIIDGIAKRKPMTHLILGVKDLLLGGVADIETILVRGERLPTWKEVGLAALDVTVVAGGVGAVAKAARLGVDAAGVVEKSTLRLAAEGAYEAVSTIGKTSVLVTPIAFVYVAITRPQLLASAGGWIAEQVGVNRVLGIFAVYWVGIFLLLQFLRPLLWCGRTVGKPIFRLARYAYTKGVA